ncbi:19154_t:CDS:2, partial [Gigaspora margarita]
MEFAEHICQKIKPQLSAFIEASKKEVQIASTIISYETKPYTEDESKYLVLQIPIDE